jgi:hypothetical protein
MTMISGFFNLIPSVLILIGAIQLVSKFFEPEAYLMLIGAITAILSTTFYSIVLPLLPSDVYSLQMSYFSIVGAVAGLGHLAFGIGFFLLVRKLVARKA